VPKGYTQISKEKKAPATSWHIIKIMKKWAKINAFEFEMWSPLDPIE
jgi:hypothetical protein